MEKAADIDTDDDDVHPVNTTDNGADVINQAEKFAVYQLEYDRGNNNGTETVAVYGIQPNSRYWKDLNIGDGKVVFGAGLADKFGWNENQQVNPVSYTHLVRMVREARETAAIRLIPSVQA